MKFSTTIIDPPWSYARTSKTSSSPGAESEKLSGYVDEQYPTMTTEELASLPVGEVSDNVLLVWATGPFIPAALSLVTAWGFEYVTMAYWHKSSAALEGTLEGRQLDVAFPHKPKYGVGYWLRGDTEPIILAKKKGSPSYRTPARATFVTRGGDHSEKPDVLHAWAERYLINPTSGQPFGPRLEIFARRKRDGWTCVGNECPGTVGQDVRTSLQNLIDV